MNKVTLSGVIEKNKNLSAIWIMTAAFLCYTGMYAVRKAFLAGQYLDLDLGFNLDTKTVLVISQVLGYMVSKFMGIKVISEMSHNRRSKWLISLVSFALAMLLLFSFVPPELKIITLFFNGLPLGMVFGVVLSYIEGRKNTELLAAALSATFIFSTGLVKTSGLFLMQNFNISEPLMPFTTGLLFFPLFLLAVWMLNKAGTPTQEDIKARFERVPMTKTTRKKFLKKHGVGFSGLVVIYIVLTIVRDFRDNFVVEFWSELGYTQQPGLITFTEIPVAIIVLIIAAIGVLIRNNQKAFNLGMWLTALGAATILIATLLFKENMVSPVFWMVSTGIGIYLPYILFHCLMFERLIAMLKFKGNVGFLFYTADALGYLGSVLILVLKESIDYKGAWTTFFIKLNLNASIAIIIFVIFSVIYFIKRTKKNPQIQLSSNCDVTA